jgi:hypothetical protein
MTALAGNAANHLSSTALVKGQIYGSILRLAQWLDEHDYRAYDTFDGLNARFLRPLTFEAKFLRQALQQGVRRFPVNLRPALGITPEHSSKGMGFLARGFVRLHQVTGDAVWADRARLALEWLLKNTSPGYSGACWGNHFDYQSRSAYFPKGLPTVVWTSLIGHAFLDAYEHFQNASYLEVVVGACEHICRDLTAYQHPEGVCISYAPGLRAEVHNANALGGSLLARTYSHTGSTPYLELAQKALRYSAHHQNSNGSWYYGEAQNLHWVDNFHTAYVLDCFRYYSDATGDRQFDHIAQKGFAFWKATFFLEDGTPRYYDSKTLPIDIQCCSQAIDTLCWFAGTDGDAEPLAQKVAQWTIANMQDDTGYFYYRRYSRWLVNKTPTLHWGQATMLCALGGLYKQLCADEESM